MTGICGQEKSMRIMEIRGAELLKFPRSSTIEIIANRGRLRLYATNTTKHASPIRAH